MTVLEGIVLNHLSVGSIEELKAIPRKSLEAMLDSATAAIMAEVTATCLLEHTRTVYTETAGEYVVNPHNLHIIDELIEFMVRVPDGERVLDIGCGTGRDAVFMSCSDRDFRASLMLRERNGKKTLEKYPVPEKRFYVVGIDGSVGLLAKAQERLIDLPALATAQIYPPIFSIGDMHDLAPYITILGPKSQAGIWSCTALFTHTPYGLLEATLQSVADLLKPGGIFFASYTNGKVTCRYDKLLASSTGRIKYFSQPDPGEVAELARRQGLRLTDQTFSDFEVGGKVLQKGLFVSQFFVKQ